MLSPRRRVSRRGGGARERGESDRPNPRDHAGVGDVRLHGWAFRIVGNRSPRKQARLMSGGAATNCLMKGTSCPRRGGHATFLLLFASATSVWGCSRALSSGQGKNPPGGSPGPVAEIVS